MKKFLTSILLIFAIVFAGLSFGCDHAKAIKTVRSAENKAAESLIYIHNIAKANNDAFEAGDISTVVHKPVNDAAGKALQAVNAFIRATEAAKAAVAAGADPNGQVDILKALFNNETARAVLSLVGLVATVPASLAVKIGSWVAGLKAVVLAFTVLFAQIDQEVKNHAG
jgi:hypothetical protein